MSKEESILRKIEGLMATARDEASSEEEAQSALLMAQRLMMKYNIDEGRFNQPEEFAGDTIYVTDFKTLTWWERQLAAIVARNFRTKSFIESHMYGGAFRIAFFGDKKDLEIAKEVYEVGRESFNYFTKNYYKQYYQENPDTPRGHAATREMKKSYQLGFLVGLEDKFKKQVSSMLEEFGIMVLNDEEVSEAFDAYGEEVGMKTRKMSAPAAKDAKSFNQGVKDGRSTAIGKKHIEEAK